MAKADAPRPDASDEPSDEGIIHDEYTDPSFVDGEPDALDMTDRLRSDGLLDEIADGSDGIESIDTSPSGQMMDTIDTGARQRSVDDEGDMAFGGEAHSAEELEDVTIGHELRGIGAVTRDDEVHGERMFDSPDDPEEDEDSDAE